MRSRYSPGRYTHLTEILFARWFRNLTLTLTLTLTLKVKIIYAVKDDTETKLHNSVILSYFPMDGGGFITGL